MHLTGLCENVPFPAFPTKASACVTSSVDKVEPLSLMLSVKRSAHLASGVNQEVGLLPQEISLF